MTIVEWLLVGFVVGFGLAFMVCFVLGMCRVAGEADEAAERMYQAFEKRGETRQ